MQTVESGPGVLHDQDTTFRLVNAPPKGFQVSRRRAHGWRMARWSLAPCLLAVALTVAGCGGSGRSSPIPASTLAQIRAEYGQLTYVPSSCREAHLHFVADRGTAVRIPPADPGNHISATTASYSYGLCSTNGTQTIRTSSREVTVRSILTRPIRERSTLSASTTSPPTTATALGRARPSTSAWVSGPKMFRVAQAPRRSCVWWRRPATKDST